MYIEEELLGYLSDHMAERGGNKDRDRKLIAYYYGFGDIPWPTYKQVAQEFKIGSSEHDSRERVRQIINYKFLDSVSIQNLPVTLQAAKLIESYTFVSSRELISKLTQEGFGDSALNVKGLLNILHDLGKCSDYNIYDSGLRKLTRLSVNSRDSSYLIHESILPDIKAKLKKARTLPGLLGLARFEDLRVELGDDAQESFSKITDLISGSEDYCSVELANDKWYTIEGRDNALINSCEKLFGVIDSCEISTLSTVLANSLHRRSHKHKFHYPSKEVIEVFLQKSRSFEIHGSSIRFIGKTSGLTDIEAAVVKYLKESGKSDFPALKNHLATLGYGEPAAAKAINNSPLVFVDKRSGRAHHTYQLVPNSVAENWVDHEPSNRYTQFKNRLQKLIKLGTDVSTESTSRREQGILQEWLFSDISVAECAICGRTYSVRALVAAHKKKRANCTEDERVDPYIVMPLCVFGCDFLYENGFITIDNGKVCEGKIPKEESADKKAAIELVGKRVAECWLAGSHKYFNAS